MKVIIAGSRTVTDMRHLEAAIARFDHPITAVISGCAKGADRLGERWAESYGIPVERYPADWDTHGKSAGYRRNEQMAEIADAVIILWDGTSRGSKHMIDIAKRKGLITLVHYTNV